VWLRKDQGMGHKGSPLYGGSKGLTKREKKKSGAQGGTLAGSGTGVKAGKRGTGEKKKKEE